MKALNEIIYIRAYKDFRFFAEYFFGHYCKVGFSPMHFDFFEAEVDPEKRGRREVIAAPRGNAKTTFKVLIKVVHAIVYNLEDFVLVIGHSAPEAIDKVRTILQELETNERLIQVYGNLAPRQGKKEGPQRYGTRSFVTKNGVLVMAKSKGQQVRGLQHRSNRPTLIICDDVESAGGVLSPEQRGNTRGWFYKDVMKCGQVDGSTNVTLIGTCLHPDSLLSGLLRAPGWKASKYQAILAFSKNQELWEVWKRIYTNLSDPNRKEAAQAYFELNKNAMLEGAQVLWPEGEPYESLMRQMIDDGIASFYSEKQNDPYDPERQLFDMTKAQKVKVLWDGKRFAGVQWADGKVIPRTSISRIVAFHDPALGKKQGQNSEPDYAAIVVVAEDKDGYLYCLDAYIEKEAPAQQVERAYQLQQKWQFETLYMEINNFQELMEYPYKDAQERYSGQRLTVKGVKQHQNKFKRISMLEPEISNGYLRFAEGVTPRLWDQLALFPTTYDDGPDALHGAVAQLKVMTTAQMYDAFYNRQ